MKKGNSVATVGQLLSELRQQRGLSIGDLAHEVGCHKSHISRFEDGTGTLGKKIAEKLHDIFAGDITREMIVWPELFPQLYAAKCGKPTKRVRSQQAELQEAC